MDECSWPLTICDVTRSTWRVRLPGKYRFEERWLNSKLSLHVFAFLTVQPLDGQIREAYMADPMSCSGGAWGPRPSVKKTVVEEKQPLLAGDTTVVAVGINEMEAPGKKKMEK